MVLFKGLCRLFIKATHMHVHPQVCMHIDTCMCLYVHSNVHAHMHVFSVNMPERQYLHIQVCVCWVNP